MNTVHTTLARTGFIRPTTGRVVGGVCAGIAERYSLDAWAVRIAFLALLMLLPGSQFLVYPLAWLMMPSAEVASALGHRAGPQDAPMGTVIR